MISLPWHHSTSCACSKKSWCLFKGQSCFSVFWKEVIQLSLAIISFSSATHFSNKQIYKKLSHCSPLSIQCFLLAGAKPVSTTQPHKLVQIIRPLLTVYNFLKCYYGVLLLEWYYVQMLNLHKVSNLFCPTLTNIKN